MDPTNGYTAIHCKALALLPLDKLNPGYFFESDMLFRLGTIRAVVQDITMNAKYKDERSNLRIGQAARQFPMLYLKAFFKRVFYIPIFLRDFNGGESRICCRCFVTSWGGLLGSQSLDIFYFSTTICQYGDCYVGRFTNNHGVSIGVERNSV